MSITYNVYAQRAGDFTFSDLGRTLAEQGWALRAFTSISEWQPADEAQAVTGGSYDLLGWQDNAQTDELDDVVARRDLPRLEALLQAEELGSCALDVTDLDAEGYDADEREELVDGAGDDVVRFVAKAAYLMTVRTSAGRTAADFELQVTVWGALGWVAKGLVENEEDGTFLFSPTSEEAQR